MGLRFAVAIERRPVYFCRNELYSITGKRRTDLELINARSGFEDIAEKLFADVLEKRQEVIRAKKLLTDFDVEAILEKYPHFDSGEIELYKGEFIKRDLDEDGLLNFAETCQVLDAIKAHSNSVRRWEQFKKNEIGELGAITFEGFLNITIKLTTKNAASQTSPTDPSNQDDIEETPIIVLAQTSSDLFKQSEDVTSHRSV